MKTILFRVGEDQVMDKWSALFFAPCRVKIEGENEWESSFMFIAGT